MNFFDTPPDVKFVEKLNTIGMAFSFIEDLVTKFPENILDTSFVEEKPKNVFEMENMETKTIILKIEYIYDERIKKEQLGKLDIMEKEILKQLESIKEQKDKIGDS